MFDGLRQASAVVEEPAWWPSRPLPLDVTASEFCNALTRLGYELGWQGNTLAPGASPTAVKEKAANAKRPMLGHLLPTAGLFRSNDEGALLLSWGEYLQILSMCEAAVAAARGATSDGLESKKGPRDLVEDLTSDLLPPKPMSPVSLPPSHAAPAATAPPPHTISSATSVPPMQFTVRSDAPQMQSPLLPHHQQPLGATSPLPLPPPMPLSPTAGSNLSPPKPPLDNLSSQLRQQITASELALAASDAASLAAAPYDSLLAKSFFPVDSTTPVTGGASLPQTAFQGRCTLTILGPLRLLLDQAPPLFGTFYSPPPASQCTFPRPCAIALRGPRLTVAMAAVGVGLGRALQQQRQLLLQ